MQPCPSRQRLKKVRNSSSNPYFSIYPQTTTAITSLNELIDTIRPMRVSFLRELIAPDASPKLASTYDNCFFEKDTMDRAAYGLSPQSMGDKWFFTLLSSWTVELERER